MRSYIIIVVIYMLLFLLAGNELLAQQLPLLNMVSEAAKVGHPRLLLTDERVAELKQLAEKDEDYQNALDNLKLRAKLYLDKSPITDNADWNTWRETLARVYIFGFCYRYTGEDQYAQALRKVLLTAAQFTNWHADSSFLDTAEMTHAIALGYDWLYHDLSVAERDIIRQALLQKGLQPGMEVYEGKAKASWWPRSNHNWNLVCNSGLIVGALALDGEDALFATSLLKQAVISLRYALPSYDPDSSWMEGPYYWEYATRYLVIALASMQTALDNDFSLSESAGLADCWKYPKYFTAPNVPTLFAYADSLDNRWNLPFIFWFAKRFNNESAAAAEREYFGKVHPWWSDINQEVKDPRFAVNRTLDLIWYLPPAIGVKMDHLPLDAHFKGKVELVSFRSSWDKASALCVFVKAGANGALVNHGHCDAGQFEIYALGNGGIRWASDIKKGPYLEGFFDFGTTEKPGKRWNYPITNAFGHNVLVLNNENQNPFASAPISSYGSSEKFSFAVIDLTPVYQVKKVMRGVSIVDKQQVLVQDELTLENATEVVWGMNCEASIKLDGNRAILTRWGTANDCYHFISSRRIIRSRGDKYASFIFSFNAAKGKFAPCAALHPALAWNNRIPRSKTSSTSGMASGRSN